MEEGTCHRQEDLASDALRAAAYRHFEAGRAAWPQLALSFDTFARYFERHVAASQQGAYAADMYLACASAYGVDGALAVFESTLAADVARAIASVNSSRAFVEDTLQAVRERLLVRKGSEPSKISDYGGRSSLRSWLCVVAARLAISQRRRAEGRCCEEFTNEHDKRLAKGTPELEFLHRRYKVLFEEAVRHTIERLPSRKRLLLRLNLVDGMSIDRIGTMYRVGRSTAARWLAGARQTLLEGTRQELRTKLRVTPEELESLAADLRSQLDVSVLKLLRSSMRDPK